MINTKTVNIILNELEKAIAKHPEFPDGPTGLSLIMEEVGELAQAINDGDCTEHQLEEAAHIAVTAIRFIEELIKND